MQATRHVNCVALFNLMYCSQSLDFLACLAFRKALAIRRHIRFVMVIVPHCFCFRFLVENFEGTLSDTIFYKLSVMMIASFSTGVKVVFEEMKSFVQLEIFRYMSSMIACFHKKSYGEMANDEGYVSLSLQRQYRDHFDQTFQNIV